MDYKYSVCFYNIPFQLESPNANTQIQMQIHKYTNTNAEIQMQLQIQIHKYKNTNKMDFKYSVCFGNTPFQLESSACCRKAIVLRKEINPTNVFIKIYTPTNTYIYKIIIKIETNKRIYKKWKTKQSV